MCAEVGEIPRSAALFMCATTQIYVLQQQAVQPESYFMPDAVSSRPLHRDRCKAGSAQLLGQFLLYAASTIQHNKHHH